MSFESPNNPTPPQENIPPLTPQVEIPKHIFSKDAHEVLGLAKNATAEEAEEAKKNLQKRFHPDVNNSSSAREAAININNAYDILVKKDKKAVLSGITGESGPKIEKSSGNEMVILAGTFDIGPLTRLYWQNELKDFCKSKNVEVKLSFVGNLSFAGQRYRIELKGRHIDTQAVSSYLKSSPWSMI